MTSLVSFLVLGLTLIGVRAHPGIQSNVRVGSNVAGNVLRPLNNPFMSEDRLVHLGNMLTEQKRYEKALWFYSKAIKRKPSEASYYGLRGNCYSELGNLNMALSDFEQAISIATEQGDELETFVLNDTELVKLGMKFCSAMNFEEALWCYNRAINSKPTEPLYYELRGSCYSAMGDVNMALSDFMHALSLAEKSGRQDTTILNETELRKLGDKMYYKRKYEEAIWCYTEAIKIRPSEAQYYRMRANCYLKMRKVQEAIIELKTALQIDPYEVNYRTDLSQLLFDSGRYEECIQETLHLDDMELAKLGDKFMYMAKRFDEALRCYTEAIKKNPENGKHYTNRGLCYVDMDKSEMAIADFQKHVQLEPHDTRAWYFYIETLFRLGKHKQAINETGLLLNTELKLLADKFMFNDEFEDALLLYDEAIRRSPSEENFRDRGHCHLKMKNLDMAISDFREVVKMNPNNMNYRIDLNQTLFDAGKYEEAITETIKLDDIHLMRLGSKFLSSQQYEYAIRCYNEAIKMNPENTICYEERGMAHWRMNKFAEAILDFKKATELVPSLLSNQLNLCEVLAEAEEYDEAEKTLAVFELRNGKFLRNTDYARIKRIREKIKTSGESSRESVLDRPISTIFFRHRSTKSDGDTR